ncbi:MULTISPECIES: betaine/proline/choline family ABC transporter ATP-binding protein [Lactococcus]|uniref:betaine/proline/choline family ABC transporter ATP-binding protein n=1 Tax=Lactococcus TaxID=1357 RepID=UPI00203EB284|nr:MULTISPECIES: betaine/proline/choline family ABC transporter ATP-binding protein [Lactococcus]
MIRFEKVNKVYGENHVLKDVSLEINTGELICVIGTSGSGKTTMTRMINRMNEPTSGIIRINGEDIQQLNEVQLRRKIGYVIQNIGLFPHMTIRENIMLVPKLLKWTSEQKKGVAEHLIAKVDLPVDYLERKPESLSGGQQQRIGVIRALAASQNIILMDEPFGALDPITRKSLQDLVKKLHREMQKTIVLVTHDMDEALMLADRIIVMKQGEVIQFAKPVDILEKPANEFVKSLFSSSQKTEISTLFAEEIMEERVISVTMNSAVSEALSLMAEHKRRTVAVIDEKNIFKGKISRDFLELFSPSERIDEALLDKENAYVTVDTTFRELIKYFKDERVRELFVVDKEMHPKGLISQQVFLDVLYNQFS